MKIIDILPIIHKNTKIKVFSDDNEIGTLYISPLSSALKNKYYFDINTIEIKNNILVLKTSSK